MRDTTRSALLAAADQIGWNEYRRQLADHTKRGRSPKTFRMIPTSEHEGIIRALDEDWSDDDAMALLHSYDAMKQRFTR